MKFVSCIIVFLIMIPTYANCTTKLDPPKEMEMIFEHFEDMEKGFKKGDLTTAIKHFEEANTLVGAVLPSLREHTHRQDLKIFRTKFMELKDTLQSRNSELIEHAYIDTQKNFFILADYYHYHPPLFLKVVGECIKEACEEGLEEKNYKEVEMEMDEIIEFIEYFDKSLLQVGITNDQIEDFVVLSLRIKRAATTESHERVEEHLNKLKEMYGEFAGAYK